MLTLQELQSDFDLLRNCIMESHGGLYRFSDSLKLNQKFDRYRANLDTVHSRLGFISLISAMLAEPGDGHMRLEYDSITTVLLGTAKLFPFRVMLTGDRFMVVYNETKENTTIVPGMEIVSINGHKISALTKLILPKISGDGYMQTGKRRKLERNFPQHYWLFVDQSNEFTVVAKDTNGDEVITKVSGVLTSERLTNRFGNPVNQQMLSAMAKLDGPKDNFFLKFPEGAAVASLRIRTFDDSHFMAGLDSVFNLIQSKKPTALILDLRGNGGGVDNYGAALVSHFTAKPFRYLALGYASCMHTRQNDYSTTGSTIVEANGSGHGKRSKS